MHDTLIINIPLDPTFVAHKHGNTFTIVGDLHMYGVRTVGGVRYDRDTGQTSYYDLKSPFESLPSSFDGMAFKFYHITTNCIPYVSINASPKFIQGHNVFGTDDISMLALEMLGQLKQQCPDFFPFLDLPKAYISRIDITYFARLPQDGLMADIIAMIGVIKVGQRKPDLSRNKYATTRYWGVAANRFGYCKLYAKDDEVQSVRKSLERKARAGNTQAKALLKVFNDDLAAFAKNLLRFEATCKKAFLEQHGYPTNLWQFIRNRPNLSPLWQHYFNPILDAIKGEIMTTLDDTEILNLCRAKLFTITKSGNIRYTRANNAYRFYVFLKDKGFDHAKSVMTARTFQDNVKALCDLGIPKAHLQNLRGNLARPTPLAKLVTIDFTNQLPDWYTPTISSFYNDFEHLIKPQLNLVA